MPPALSCEQREQVHRVLPWAVRTYYYGAGSAAVAPEVNDTYHEHWYSTQRAEGVVQERQEGNQNCENEYCK